MGHTGDAYDVFFSYHRPDLAAVEGVAQALRQQGLKVFLDRWYLAPGRPWPQILEEVIASCRAVAVFVGASGLGPWQQREKNLALSRWARQPEFPVIPVLLPGADPALDFLSQNTWVDLRPRLNDPLALEILQAAIRGEPPGPDLKERVRATLAAVCPYRGLLPFREEDAPFFFGREVFVDRLTQAVCCRSLVAVVGASGCGKSSVARAGLLPRVRQSIGGQVWDMLTLLPDRLPLNNLAAALLPLLEPEMTEVDRLAEVGKLTRYLQQGDLPLRDVVARVLAKQPGTDRLLLLVDQWEELYTRTREEEQRGRFLEEILQATQDAPLTVVLTLRGDFFGQALSYRPLADRLQDAVVTLGPMTREELARAVEEPARKVGLAFEPGLVERLLDDVGLEPGNLPLLEFALTRLWEQRRGRQILHQVYEDMGRVQGAVAQQAEEMYQKLGPLEQQAATRVFLELVQTGENTEDTRRRAALAELGGETRELVKKLADARLVVTGREEASGQDLVEVAHEALIQNWQRLQGWLNADREFLLWRQRLRHDLEDWQRTGRDEGALLRGAPLAEAERWLAGRAEHLTPGEREFIQAGLALREQERLARHRQHRFKVMALTSGLVLALVLLALAGWQWRRAEGQRQVSLARQLAAQANFLLAEHPLMVERSVLLALESLKREITPDGGRALSRGLSLLTPRLARVSQEGKVEAVIYSPDGRLLACVSSNTKVVIVRDTASGVEVARLVHPEKVEGGAHRVAVAFSPNGRLLATGCEDGYARLWDPATGREVRRLDHGGHDFSDGSGKTRHNVNHVAFSPDGTRLAASAHYNSGRVWEVATGRELYSLAREEFREFNDWMYGVQFSPDGRWLAVAFDIGLVHLLEAADGRVATKVDAGAFPDAMAFSPDSRWLATGLRHGRTLLMDTADNYRVAWLDHSPPRDTTPPGAPRKFINYGSEVNSIAFRPDSRWLATGYMDGQVRLWSVADGREIRRLQYSSVISQINFSPDGGLLAVAYYDNAARVYETTRWREVVRLIHDDNVLTVAFHPKGQGMATGGASGQVQLWAAPSPFQEVARLSVTPKGDAQKVCFSPDGRWLAAAFVRYKSDSDKALLWDVRAGRVVAHIQPPRNLAAITFSPDSRYLAIGSGYNPSREWLVTRSETDGERKSSAVKASSPAEGTTDAQKPTAPASVLVLETDSLREVTRLSIPSDNLANWVKFSPDSRILATWKRFENAARLWDVASGRELVRLVHDKDKDIETLAFSPDGRLVATGSSDNTARLWEVTSGRELQRLEFKYPPKVGFSPAGRWLVSHDGEIHLIDPATGKETGRMPGYDIEAFNPPGNWLLTGKDRAAYLREIDSGKEISQFRHSKGVGGAAFSPDGRWVASGEGYDDERGTVHLWEAATGQEWCRLHHDYRIRSLAFSPDGKLLATASLDGTVRLWRWQPEDLIRQACSCLTRNLTKAEWKQYLPSEALSKTCPNLPGPQD